MAENETGMENLDEFRQSTQELYVPVHGYVSLYPEETAVIDHPAYQRLRRLRQLGFAHLVFPGASHSRFEHAIGALHVAAKIMDHLDQNHEQDALSRKGTTHVRSLKLSDPQKRFVRLAALGHDIGHLPFSHTLEDELGHLNKHDGAERLYDIADREWSGGFCPSPAVAKKFPALEGATLRVVIDELYREWLEMLFDGAISSVNGTQVTSFELFCTLVSKESDLTEKGPPEAREQWKQKLAAFSKVMPVKACRDIVGDTICADFLDYIHRDWHHIGKPIQKDDRIFHYMRVLREKEAPDEYDNHRFVIDVGPKIRLRHDAITLILDLLDSRYKLTETVLYHRTKLCVIALLDRILLDIRDLWRAAGIKDAESELQNALMALLMDHCDDRLGVILDRLREGADYYKAVQRTVDHGLASLLSSRGLSESPEQPMLGIDRRPDVIDQTLLLKNKAVKELFDNIGELIGRLENRDLYTLAERIDVDVLGGVPSENNRAVDGVISIYKHPENRHALLRMLEDTCNLPRGSVLMYCPPANKMGAKVAKVHLHIDGRIQQFDAYEKEAGATGLTCNALSAQVSRFYQLWSVSFFVDRTVWSQMGHDKRGVFRHLIRVVFDPNKDESDRTARQTEALALIKVMTHEEKRAARSGIDETGDEVSHSAAPSWKLASGLELPCNGR